MYPGDLPESPSPRPQRNDLVATDKADLCAKQLRKDLTSAERKLWIALREGRNEGLPFRRQHPCGPFIADFFCHAAGLVVELDGAAHEEREEYDASRDRWMRERNLQVLRYKNEDVEANPQRIADTVLEVARQRVNMLGR